MRRFRLGYLLRIAYFLLYSILVVPFSTEDYLHWTAFLTGLGIRIAIVFAFVEITQRILDIDRVDIASVVPPTLQDAELVADESAMENHRVSHSRPLRVPFKIKLIPFVSGALFIGNLFLNRNSYTPLLGAPAKAIALLSEILASFLLALFVASLLFWLAIPVPSNPLPLKGRVRKLLRLRSAVFTAIVLSAAAFWVDQSVG